MLGARISGTSPPATTRTSKAIQRCAVADRPMVSIVRTPDGRYRVLLMGCVGAVWATSLADAMHLAYTLTSSVTSTPAL